MNFTKYSTLHPLLYRAKTLLIVLSVALIVANLYILSTTRSLANSYTDQRNYATWYLFQLTKEYSELVASIPYYLESKEKRAHTWLQYELIWSRFDLILTSKESDNFMGRTDSQHFFKNNFDDFKILESLLLAVKDQKSLAVFEKHARLIYDQIIGYVNQNFQLQSPIYLEQKEKANRLTQVQFLLMFLMLGCIGLVSYIFHKEAVAQRTLALTDPLTGLANRLAMFEELNQISTNNPFSLFLLDLNGFKPINDQNGHKAGDSVLQQVAFRLTHSIPTFDYSVFRMGGDEFALIIHSVDAMELSIMQRHIKACFKENFFVDNGVGAKLSTSIGIASFPKDSANINQLIHIADKNMYAMKFLQKSPSV
ncbi:GGDEF domain-containing protein [Vibrio anguillarum]|uniref:GGDEF domain-containing protein n=1 Tax=Vibrio TaxID=662 RepID=UPI000B539635|nr:MULTISPECIES: GGDEF domain-containing protein [Vibrio]ASG09617.1 GGDEF domain-containing protein [Vibrio anguillarum]ASO30632.1 GGDEF domain-containing protein [Vibrio anguillarum]MCC4236466.1 GGDEF domain-containing protein [Vibrio anguillarum]MCS0351401.1 GGDEF domain-containing protein [Vibrio ordalii]MDT3847332.1 GGDEF domain-containing protein [Vibrio anguillarum]